MQGWKDTRPQELLEQVPQELVVHLVVILHFGCLYHGAEGAGATIRRGALELCVTAFHVGAKKRRGLLRLLEVFNSGVNGASTSSEGMTKKAFSWFSQYEERVVASLKFADADGICANELSGYLCGIVTILQEYDFRRRPESIRKSNEVRIRGENSKPVLQGVIPNFAIRRTATEANLRHMN
jgi:hypothetical protein